MATRAQGTTPTRVRGHPPRAGAAVPAAGAGEVVREARGARRRRETRARLLDAALKLMADRGMDGVAINEITEAADVGFGSFYNHFESKEAIHRALTDLVFEEFANALDRARTGVTDRADIRASSVRHTLYRARRDRTWALFLLRESLSSRMLTRGLGSHLLRDIEKGIGAGRFKEDPNGKGGVRVVKSIEVGGAGDHGGQEDCHFSGRAERVLEGAGVGQRKQIPPDSVGDDAIPG